MRQGICGDCKSYNRVNPWSGTWGVDNHATSPGVRCEIERFEPHGARAMLRHEWGTFPLGGGDFKPFPPTPVEVLAVVGLWAMVRNAEAPASYRQWWGNAHVDTSQPYVVQAVLLDYGSGKQ